MEIETSRSRVLWAIILIVAVFSGGTIGYTLLEGWSIPESLYMTVITMTTVGFGEIRPLSEEGRLFTILLILTSIGIVGYVFSMLSAFVVEGKVRQIFWGRKMDKQIAQLKNHIILCGLGRIGLQIAEEFQRMQVPFVVIEQDEEALETGARLEGMLSLRRDATQEDTLLLAGIKEARGLITTLSEDKDNVFVVLCARSLKPDIYIIARLVEEHNEMHLRKAGANRIVSPDAIGGRRMASIMLRPNVVEFWDEMQRVTGETLIIEEMCVDEFPGLQNRSLGEINIRKRTGALVLAIKSQEHGYQFNPGASTVLRQGDELIIVGTSEQVDPERWASECGR